MILRLRRLLQTLPVLIALSLLLAGITALAIAPASRYIIEQSVSTVNNFYLLGGIMALVMLASAVQALLAIRLLWGANAIWGSSTPR